MHNSIKTYKDFRLPCSLVWAFFLTAVPPVFAQNESRYGNESVLEEVIVIAQKRAENAQDIPVAVSTMNRQAIEESGMLTIQELTDLNPSVSFDTAQSFQNSSLKIRGIGTVGNGRTFEGSVGVFIDGIYRTRSGMALLDMLDIDRVEVMRGPQGTLFGKNTVAGAISLRSTRPGAGELGGQAELRLGNYGETYILGILNTPLSDSGAMRLAASFNQRDGFISSPDNGDEYDAVDRYAFKGQFLFNPNEDVEVLLIADYAKSDAHCCWASPQVFNGPAAELVGIYSALNGLSFTPAPQAEQQRLQSLNTLPREVVKDSGVAAIIDWDIGETHLKSITSYRDWEQNQIEGDADFVAADLLTLNEPASIQYFSQEFNLSIVSERMDWLLGFYYAKEDYESTRTLMTSTDTDNYLNTLLSGSFGATLCLPPIISVDCTFPPGLGALLDDGELSREFYQQDADNWALFAHGVTELTEHSNLVIGLRYNVEEKKGGVDNLYWYDSAIVRAVLAGLGIPDDGTPRNGLDLIGTTYSPSFSNRTKDEEITGTISYQYFFNDETMIYAKYDRGYKSGGVNLFREAVVTDTQTYDPEYADSIELGLKMDYLNGRARTNVTLFHTEFTDLQINFFDGFNFRTENTGEATSKGVEFENNFQLSNDWRLDFAVTWLDAEFGNIEAPELSYLVNRDTPRAPRWAGVLALNWERPVFANKVIFARGLASYTGSHYVGADVAGEEKVDAYTITDLSFGLRADSGRWEVVAWCKNCGNEDYRTIFFNSTFQTGSHNAFLNSPRQYGVTLRARF